MRLVNQPLAFVDIETSGGQPTNSRVIEVGVVRVEQSKVVDSFQTLVDPGDRISPQITRITGITSEQLDSAPTFRQINDRLLEILDGCIFIAHNVGFDYSFIKSELDQVGEKFEAPQLCTARLSRTLFPQFRKHSLDALIERHGLPMQNRHRAYDDALAMWYFMQMCLTNLDLDTIDAAASMQLRRQAYN